MNAENQTQTKKRTVVRIGAYEVQVASGTKVSALKTLLAIPPEIEVRVVEDRARTLSEDEELREGHVYDVVPVLRGA